MTRPPASVVCRSLIVCLPALLLLRAAPTEAQDRGEVVSALDSAAAVHAADSTVAGVAVAVVHRGDTQLLEGYGLADLEFEVPTPPAGVYEIGSITKQFTAAAVLQLAGADSLGLDDDVTDHLENLNTRGHEVTVRDLLHHTSGLRSYTTMSQFFSFARDGLPRDTVVSLVGREPFDFAPGTAMIYNNSGYFLLGLIVEAVSGTSYEDYVEEHLFGPAGMEDSYYCDQRTVTRHRAHGYAWAGERGFVHKAYLDHTWPYAAGSLCSTAGDLVAWNQALHGGRILPDSLYREMIAPGRLDDGTELRYAMGLAVAEQEGRRVVGHGGGINGFLSQSLYLPDDDLIVVTLQNTSGGVERTPAALADSLTKVVLGPGDEPDGRTYEGDVSELTGHYTGPARGELMELEIAAEDGELVVREVGSEDEEGTVLEYVSDLTWREGGDRYGFVRAGDQIVELRLDVVSGHYPLRKSGPR